MSSSPTKISRITRVRHELKLRALTVTRVVSLSPHVRSITLAGPDLHDFVSASFDDHVKVMIPASEATALARRDYTPRKFDPVTGELTLEFALHGSGPAAEWANQAAPGMALDVGGPRGSMIIPMDFDWHWLIGDESALPAIARRLEELPAQAVVQVLLRVTDPSDQRTLPTRAQATVQWVHSDADCLAALTHWHLPEGEGFVWCAGEAAWVAEARRIVVDDKGVDKTCVRASAYWKRGISDHHENLS